MKRARFRGVGESFSKMTGLIGFAPVYLNGLLAIFFVLVLLGLVFVRGFDIGSFPQRSGLRAFHLLLLSFKKAGNNLRSIELPFAASMPILTQLKVAAAMAPNATRVRSRPGTVFQYRHVQNAAPEGTIP